MQEVATGRVGLPRIQSFEEMEAHRNFNRFQAKTKEEYQAKLSSLSTFDLSNHAVTVGVRPGSDRARTQKALMTAFDNAKSAVSRNFGLAAVEGTRITTQVKDSYQEFLDKFNAAKTA